MTILSSRLGNLLDLEVAQGYDDAAVSILVDDPGGLLPAAPFPLTWYEADYWLDPSKDPKPEIVWVTAVSSAGGDQYSLTVRRGEEDTTAQTHNDPGKTYRVRGGITRDLLGNNLPWASVLDYNADPTGSADSYASFQAALDALVAAGGGVLLVPPGTYSLSDSVQRPTETPILVLGLSRETTIIKNGATVAGGLFNFTGGRFEFRGLGFVLGAAAGDTPAIAIDSKGSGEDADLRFFDLAIEQKDADASGIVFTNNGADLRRVRASDLDIRNTGSGSSGSSTGFRCTVGNKVGRELEFDRIRISGFHDGFDTATLSSGVVEDIRLSGRFSDNTRYGVRVFRGSKIHADVRCKGNGCGAYFDSGAQTDEEEVRISGEFRSNFIGLMVEGLVRSILNNVLVFGNTYGLWVAGRETVVSSSAIDGNTNWGVSTDRDVALVDPATSISYERTDKRLVVDILFVASSVTLNGTNGIELRGVRRTGSVRGCQVTRNGQSAAGAASSSGYSAILVGEDSTPTDSSEISIEASTIGNTTVGDSGVGTDGKEQYGVRKESGAANITVSGSSFYDLEEPLSVSGSNKSCDSSKFFRCNSITWSGAGKNFFDSSNRFIGGSLEGSEWDGRGYRSTLDGWYQDDVADSQAAVELVRVAQGAGDDGWIAPRSGSITAVFAQANAAVTAGTITVEVYVNGSATGLTAVLDTTNTTFKATIQAEGADAFVAGDRINLRVTTASLTPAGSLDLRAGVEVVT